MATEIKRISVNAIERAMKAVGEKALCVLDWNGEQLIIKRRLNLGEMLTFVDTVVENCFSEDGDYLPEIRDFIERCMILEVYANFRLPKDTERKYEFVTSSVLQNAVEVILERIDEAQYDAMTDAIDEKIDYRIRIDTEKANREVVELVTSLGDMEEQMKEIFSGMTQEDVAGLVNSLVQGVDEEKLMSAYLDRHERIAGEAIGAPQLEVIDGGGKE